MSELSLLSEISEQGITARLEGNELALSAPKGTLTPDLIARLKKEKPILMRGLRAIKRKAGTDWQEITDHPNQLKTFTELLMIGEMRERGVIPDHYSATVYCRNCNQDVPHFPVDDDAVGACVWCMNGQIPPQIPGVKQ